jgi:release factor glutamine methyltransferase
MATVATSTTAEALGSATDALTAAGVDGARFDAELLLAEATGRDRAVLAADPDAAVDPSAARRFGEMVRRRLRREPVAYIVGRRGFRHLELAVDRRVLIPRPETEMLVELALELAPESVLDVGTGSGAIALALADELPGCRVTAADTSTAALEVARANAARLGLADRVEFLEGTLPQGPVELDLVLANLPYVPEGDWLSLQPEITRWEPREALLAGPDGLDAYRELIPRLSPERRSLASSRYAATSEASTAGNFGVGAVGLEVGEEQAEAVGAMLAEAGFDHVETRSDLGGIERVVVGRG